MCASGTFAYTGPRGSLDDESLDERVGNSRVATLNLMTTLYGNVPLPHIRGLMSSCVRRVSAGGPRCGADTGSSPLDAQSNSSPQGSIDSTTWGVLASTSPTSRIVSMIGSSMRPVSVSW